ncbi:MAG: hypothetical protein AAGJ09_06335 [Pseudomonadota bacterium]
MNLFACIDWNAVAAMLSAVAALGVAIAAWKARGTFEEWREKELFLDNRKVAIDILATFYKSRDAFDQIRSPMSFGYETERAKAMLEKGKTPEDAGNSSVRQAQIILNRLSDHNDLWDRLYELMPLAQAQFGDDVKKGLQQILRIRGQIVSAAHRYPDRDNESRREITDVIWYTGGEHREDALNQDLDKACSSLEASLKKYL